MDTTFSDLQEIQLTTGEKGHFLHVTQAFSPNDEWIVYDTRNEDTHIGITCCIEMVNIKSKDTVLLYRTENQSKFGPGVGAVTFNPTRNQVLFIHGLRNCNAEHPYGFSRRTGVSVRIDSPLAPIFLDARDVTEPFTPGALRGGTHAHTWSHDGQWASFTYNDAIMTELAAKPDSEVEDLRMVGVMAPLGPVKVDADHAGENQDGELFTVVVTEVTENPKPGSDEIDRAYFDGWVGDQGYTKSNGEIQKRAVAFLGDTRDKEGNKLPEVFVVDIPDDITKASPEKPLAGTALTRPNPPKGTEQRRLTFTEGRKYPGIQGPGQPMRSLSDGSKLFFMMKDDNGVVQIYGVSPLGGDIEQVTRNAASIETAFDISPDGKYLAYGIAEKVHVTEILSGNMQVISSFTMDHKATGLRGINWSKDGKILAYNRMVKVRDTAYFQIFTLQLSDGPLSLKKGLSEPE